MDFSPCICIFLPTSFWSSALCWLRVEKDGGRACSVFSVTCPPLRAASLWRVKVGLEQQEKTKGRSASGRDHRMAAVRQHQCGLKTSTRESIRSDDTIWTPAWKRDEAISLHHPYGREEASRRPLQIKDRTPNSRAFKRTNTYCAHQGRREQETKQQHACPASTSSIQHDGHQPIWIFRLEEQLIGNQEDYRGPPGKYHSNKMDRSAEGNKEARPGLTTYASVCSIHVFGESSK